jgi:hypothetical protein
VRAEEVARAEGGGSERGGEEAAGARGAAAARAQTDHGLIRLHASGEGIRPGKRTASGSIEEPASALRKIRGGIECCGRGGFRLPTSLSERTGRGRRGRQEEVGFYRWSLGLWGCVVVCWDCEGRFVLARKVVRSTTEVPRARLSVFFALRDGRK